MTTALRKLFLCPWFGPLPPWFDQYLANIEMLKPLGYDWHITTRLEPFLERCGDILGLRPPIVRGGSKLHDLRPALGALFASEIQGYDYWGHTDFDCVYGRIDHFMPDEELQKWDIWSNHHNYICGPWTLYRNCGRTTNHLPFRSDFIMSERTTGWVESLEPGGFSKWIDIRAKKGDLTRLYTHYQGHDPNDTRNLRIHGCRLIDADDEIMMFHFNRVKRWPGGVRL